MQQSNAITQVIVVGGGAAGWLTAGILAATAAQPCAVTLVESPDVGILGVGEGTWPTMRGTLQTLGIDEAAFLAQCDGAFKQGTLFKQWQHNQASDQYYHPFSLPVGYGDGDLHAWLRSLGEGPSFAHEVSTQPWLCDNHLAPKQIQTPAFAGVTNYGYHLDAYKFAALLKQHATTRLGVKHIVDHVESVDGAPGEAIRAIVGKQYGAIHGDLFVDCSGFSARLIGQHYNQPLISCGEQLVNNRAVAIQARYKSPDTPIASVTRSTAQKNGWIWDIALPERKGTGYVFCSDYCDDDTALDTLLKYLNDDPIVADVDKASARFFSFKPGYRESPWQANCVAIGTSMGFLEPLEASALVMVELAASHLARHMPCTTEQLGPAARQFNRIFSQRWSRVVDFLKLHYVLSKRDDSAYWRYMRNPDSGSEQLQDWLSMWRNRSPDPLDFNLREEIFPTASYLYVLQGMGFTPALSGGEKNAAGDSSKVRQRLQQHQQNVHMQLNGLPTNRALLNHLTGAHNINKEYS